MSITINKTSWHYRLIASMSDSGYPPSSLCAYSAALLFCSFWACLGICGLAVAAIVLICGPIGFWLSVFDVITLDKNQFALAVCGQGVWVLAGVLWLVNWLYTWLYNRDVKKSKPTLIKAYIKAKKEKVCPIIEFV